MHLETFYRHVEKSRANAKAKTEICSDLPGAAGFKLRGPKTFFHQRGTSIDKFTSTLVSPSFFSFSSDMLFVLS
jgi:hypothetical protein